MLVLGRRNGEQVVINGNIVVTVIAATDGRVKLGFEAPVNIPINRKEIEDGDPRPGKENRSC